MAHRKSRRASRRATRRANRASRKVNRRASSRRHRRNNMMGGGLTRYVATPVRTLGEGAADVFEGLLSSTGKVAHNAVYGVSKALDRATTAVNKAVTKNLLRNPLKARTRRHRSRRA